MSSFTETLEASPLDNGIDWKLLKEFDYHVGSEDSTQVIHVPAGFVTDFASIPSPLIVIIGMLAQLAGYYWGIVWLVILGYLVVFAAAGMPRWGKYGKAAIIHDYLYSKKIFTRRITDAIFLEAMEILGVNYIESHAMYQAVRWFGWLAWKRRR